MPDKSLWFPEAHYHQNLPALYHGNPLIEALPPILLEDEAIHRLKHYPPFLPEERNHPAEWRFHSLQSVVDIFTPLSTHLQLEQRFSRVIRRGYVERNPLTRAHWQEIDTSVKALAQGAMQPVYGGIRSTATGFTLLGISGIGKTTAIKRILSLYPQVIRHRRYGGQDLLLMQIVWLKLECPHAGSVRGLCSDFFVAVDGLLGTNYYQNYGRKGRATVDQMIPAMARLASIHKIGVLVIDELQHLNEAKSGGSTRMLNFFVQLVNTIGMPVILIGTPKAQRLLSKEFRQACRSTAEGDPIWNNMKKDELWRIFLESLWQYQYVRRPVPLDDELSYVFYNETQGITDLVVKLFMVAQMRAISNGIETLTPALVGSAAMDLFRIIAPALDALRHNDRSALQGFEDIVFPKLDAQLQRALARLKKYQKKKNKTATASPPAPQKSLPPAGKEKVEEPEKKPPDVKKGKKKAAQPLQIEGNVQSIFDFMEMQETQ